MITSISWSPVIAGYQDERKSDNDTHFARYLLLLSTPLYICIIWVEYPASSDRATASSTSCFSQINRDSGWPNNQPSLSFAARKTKWFSSFFMCAKMLTNTGSSNGLSPTRHQAIIWTNADIIWGQLALKNKPLWYMNVGDFVYDSMWLMISGLRGQIWAKWSA